MKGRKKRNFLLKATSDVEEKFRSRNLNDTRYACRLLLNVLKADVQYDGVTVAARPGPLTDRLRRAWGVQSLKKSPDGERKPDDRHHALDAVIVAPPTATPCAPSPDRKNGSWSNGPRMKPNRPNTGS